ncbi:unconventional myosin-Vb [Aphis craccivora]|uniref:Unconventional myosin-Vb n=1 Tax=Aphis craccivora TaxID=307492 RepID=A0A6G0YGR1_APHCR|nr:unconventional myosin-Vb [Aphis craccivora]
MNRESSQDPLPFRSLANSRDIIEASGAYDASAKHIYASLIQWLISIMNRTMCETSPSTNCPIIGVLDIYGFEMFELNSLEQFCINYVNEKLQQQFNFHVFKLKQKEYGKEGIEWEFIDFYDNQPCIDLIESKLGILDLLDEECRMPQGSDTSWTQIYIGTKCIKWDRFSKPKIAGSTFTIKHFAGDVEYSSDGFSDKNKDAVFDDEVNVLRNGKNIKPNGNKLPFVIDHQHAMDQLRACGVLETIHIRAAGFLSRSIYEDFFFRFRILLKSKKINRDDTKLTCQRVTEYNYKYGNSKLYIRACQISILERIRVAKLNESSICIQKAWKKYICQKKYKQMQTSALLIQIYGRGYLSRWLATNLWRTKAAIKIQKVYGNSKLYFRAYQVSILERRRDARLNESSIYIQKA